MKNKKKENISIHLTGKQLTFLTTGIFAISILSFLFGVFMVKSLEPDLSIKGIVPKMIVSATIPVKVDKGVLASQTGDAVKLKANEKKLKKINKKSQEKRLTFFDSIEGSKKTAKKVVKKTVKVNKTGAVKKTVKGEKRLNEEGKYTVQVVSYRNENNAKSLLSTLLDKGYDAYVVKADIPLKGVFFRVRVGKYLKRASANTASAKLYTEEASKMKFGKPVVLAMK